MPRNLDDKFGEFDGGVSRPEVEIRDEQHELTRVETLVPVQHIDGRPVGVVVNQVFAVKMQQLELAPTSDLLYSQFHLHDATDNTDPQVLAYSKSIDSMGEMVPALEVLPINRTITINGEQLPMYRVYHDPYIYEALIFLRRAKVHVVINATNAGEILLMALSRQQLARKPSILERCDAARRLDETYGIDQNIIALHLAVDSETGEAPSQPYVSQLVNVAKLPDPVRDLVHNGLITFTHARKLLRVRQDETLCVQLANWVCDGTRKTVSALDGLITDLNPGPGLKPLAQLAERDGHIIVDRGQGLKLVEPSPDRPFTTYDHTMAVKPQAIRKEMSRFTVEVIPAETPERIALTKDSFEDLRRWIVDRRGHTTIRETEAVLLGFLEAVRNGAATAGVLNQQGGLTPVVEADTDQTRQA